MDRTWKNRARRLRLLPLALLVFAAVLVAASGAAWAQGRRVALVIGNAGYRSVAPLVNPPNDARLMARTLQQLGFTLVGGGAQVDLGKPAFERAVQQFGQAIAGAEVALFYYSGHGMQVDGENWLVPVDANPTRLQDLDFQMVDAQLVLKQMQGAGAKLNVVILDACRNNPFGGRGLRASGGGLAEMHAPEGTLISYATQPGNVASDGVGADSPYTTALSRIMREPGLDALNMFNRVGVEVKRATGGQQQPWVANSPIEGTFYFAGTAGAAAAGAQVATAAPGPAAAASQAASRPVAPASAATALPKPPPLPGAATGAPAGTPPETLAGMQPVRPNYADELTDFGVPPQAVLQTNVGSPTPTSIPGGHVITTNEIRQAEGWAAGGGVLLFDVLEGSAHPTIPGAVWLPGAGRAGSFADDTQRQLWAVLSRATAMHRERPLVFFCAGARCWESYNAALRAESLGFTTVLWYRGGLAAWEAAGGALRTPITTGPQSNGFGFNRP